MTDVLKLIELPPFDAFIAEGRSPWTFGLKEFFTAPPSLELVAADEASRETLRNISSQERNRSGFSALYNGVAYDDTVLGSMLSVAVAGGAMGGCCALIIPAVATVVGYAALIVLGGPTVYFFVKGIGQRKVLLGLENNIRESLVTTLDYKPIFEDISPSGLKKIAEAVQRLPPDYVVANEGHRQLVQDKIFEMRDRAIGLSQRTGQGVYATIANGYDYLAKSMSISMGFETPMIFKT